MSYQYKIYLRDQRSGKTKVINFISITDNYLSAWKEATENAWAELNMHDTNWYIQKIEHVL